MVVRAMSRCRSRIGAVLRGDAGYTGTLRMLVVVAAGEASPTARGLIVALVAAVCVARDAVAQRVPSALPRSHRHPGIEALAIEDSVPELTWSDTVLDASVVRERLVTDRRGRYDAFTVDGTHLYVRDRRTRRVREVRGLPFEWRAFSHPAWTGDGILLVDRWSSPHYAMHYAVDVARRRLVAAQAFHDQEVER